MTYQFSLKLHPMFCLLKRLSIMMLAYSLARLAFLAYNLNEFSQFSFFDIAKGFVHGLRFDWSALCLINAPFIVLAILMMLLPWSLSTVRKGVWWIFWLVNLPLLFINFADAAYYPFSGRRSGLEALGYSADLADQASQLLGQYWHWIAVLLVLMYGLIKLGRPLRSEQRLPMRWSLPVVFGIILITVLSIRGGWQRKPLSPNQAVIWSESGLAPLVLNTPFNVLRQKNNEIERADWYANQQQALAKVLPGSFSNTGGATARQQNVVIIIMESFGMEYFMDLPGRGSYTPFLRRLADESLFFSNSFANGRRSIDAVPSILAGIPGLMAAPFTRSPYQGNRVYGLGNILKDYGYSSWFFHGAKTGSMFFDVTTRRLGFDNYHGREEYDNDDDFDGNWGIFDEPFLQYTAQQLNAAAEPFVAGIFTISSHNPYTLPEQYQGVIPEGELPMHRVVRYADMALEKFFATASKMPWFQDTLFVITADHTSDNKEPEFATVTGRHRVPIMLYHPGGLLPRGKSERIVQQADIPATVIDFLGLGAEESEHLLPFGQTMLNTDQPGRAVFRSGKRYVMVKEDVFIKMSLDGNKAEVDAMDNSLFSMPSFNGEKAGLENELKAYIQLYKNGLIDNKMYVHSQQEGHTGT